MRSRSVPGPNLRPNRQEEKQGPAAYTQGVTARRRPGVHIPLQHTALCPVRQTANACEHSTSATSCSVSAHKHSSGGSEHQRERPQYDRSSQGKPAATQPASLLYSSPPQKGSEPRQVVSSPCVAQDASATTIASQAVPLATMLKIKASVFESMNFLESRNHAPLRESTISCRIAQCGRTASAGLRHLEPCTDPTSAPQCPAHNRSALNRPKITSDVSAQLRTPARRRFMTRFQLALDCPYPPSTARVQQNTPERSPSPLPDAGNGCRTRQMGLSSGATRLLLCWGFAPGNPRGGELAPATHWAWG